MAEKLGSPGPRGSEPGEGAGPAAHVLPGPWNFPNVAAARAARAEGDRLPPETPLKPPASGSTGPEQPAAGEQAVAAPGDSQEPLPPLPSSLLENPDPAGSLYLEIEDVVAGFGAGDVPSIFATLREELATLKGSRAEQGKKVLAALDRTEELFLHLIGVREQLTQGEPKR
jgi:hypothetical protein